MAARKNSNDIQLSDKALKLLVEFCAEFTHDPVGFVWAAYPWGEGELEGKIPDEWQLKLLADIRDGLKTPDEVIQEAIASGHGIGKSALVCWIIQWAMATFEDCKGVVTANTQNQLLTKTWSELANGIGFPSASLCLNTLQQHIIVWILSTRRRGVLMLYLGASKILKLLLVCIIKENAF